MYEDWGICDLRLGLPNDFPKCQQQLQGRSFSRCSLMIPSREPVCYQKQYETFYVHVCKNSKQKLDRAELWIFLGSFICGLVKNWLKWRKTFPPKRKHNFLLLRFIVLSVISSVSFCKAFLFFWSSVCSCDLMSFCLCASAIHLSFDMSVCPHLSLSLNFRDLSTAKLQKEICFKNYPPSYFC